MIESGRIKHPAYGLPRCPECDHARHTGRCTQPERGFLLAYGTIIDLSRRCRCSVGRTSWYRHRVLVRVLGALAVVVILAVGVGSRAHAATVSGVDIPLVGGCDRGTPLPQLPDIGLPGIFVESPDLSYAPYDDHTQAVPQPADPTELFGTSGMAGMGPFTFDQGCALNVFSTGSHVDAWTDRELSSYLVAFGQTWTAAGDSIDRRAWQPTWILTFLSDLTGTAVQVVTLRILIPFLGVGLLFASLMLFGRMRKGDTAGVAQAVAWALVVVVVGAVVIAAPTGASRLTQGGAATVTKTLYDQEGNSTQEGETPADSATETIMNAVHYDGYLRRTFGSDSSATAKHYGPLLLAATRFTWNEEALTDVNRPDNVWDDASRKATLQRRQDLIKSKQRQFDTVADQIKAEDPQAYEWVKGGQGAVLPAAYEAAFAFFASALRIAADLLLVLALILLAGLGVIWIGASPWLVTPRGEAMGRGLLNASGRSVGYAAEAGLAAWLWSLYSRIVLAPGSSSWWAFVLMAVGAFVFWTVLRPDRKALALLSTGKVRGNGKWTRWAAGRVMTGVGAGWAAGKVHAKAEREQWARMDERAQADRNARLKELGWSDDDEHKVVTSYAPIPKDQPMPVTGRARATHYTPITTPAPPIGAPVPTTAQQERWSAATGGRTATLPAGTTTMLPVPPPAGTTGLPDPGSPEPATGQAWYQRKPSSRPAGSDNDEAWWRRS